VHAAAISVAHAPIVAVFIVPPRSEFAQFSYHMGQGCEGTADGAPNGSSWPDTVISVCPL